MARPNLMRHRKFVRLAVLLRSEYVARGVLEMIWDGAYESGDERIGSAAEIEARVRWQGDPGTLADALVTAGFVDRVADDEYAIHDLWHHAPDYVKKRHAREHERSQRVTLTAKRRRTAPNGAAKRSAGTVNGRTPSPSPSPSPSQEIQERGADAPQPSALMEAWNAITIRPLPICRELTAKRHRRCAQMLTERPLEEWHGVIARIQASDFCRGQNDRGWLATFDWLLQPDVPVKVLEGKYDNRTTAARPAPPRSHIPGHEATTKMLDEVFSE